MSLIGGKTWMKIDNNLIIGIIVRGIGFGFTSFAIANFGLFVWLGAWSFDPSLSSSAIIIALIYAAATLWDQIYTFANEKAREER